MTSRIVGYSGCPFRLSGNTEDYTLTLVPFGWKETERFVKSWFHENEDAKKKGNNFLKNLKKNREMKGLSQNPLLLTLLCALYEENSGDGNSEGKIPVKRSKLYETCIYKFLTDWREEKPNIFVDEERIEDKIELYQDIAFHFFATDKEFFMKREIIKFIKKHPKFKDLKDTCECKKGLFWEISNNDGILVMAGKDKYMFLHRTFQEYLTACALSKAPLSEISESTIRSAVKESNITAKKYNPEKKLTGIDFIESQLWNFEWWEEVILLMASRFGEEVSKNNENDLRVSIAKKSNRAENLVNMLLQHDDQRSVEDAFKNPKEDREPMRQLLLPAAGSCREGNIKGVYLDKIINLLNQILDSKILPFQELACQALGKIGSNKAVEPLIKALGDKNWQVREVVAKALGEIASDKAVEPLIKALGDKDLKVYNAAAKALGDIASDKTVDLLLRHWEIKIGKVAKWQPMCWGGGGGGGGEIGSDKVVKLLIEALGVEDWEVRKAAAEALGTVGSDEAVEPLIKALGDEYWGDVRYKGCQSAGGNRLR